MNIISGNKNKNKILLGANHVKDGKLIENHDRLFSPAASFDSEGMQGSYKSNPFNVVND